MKLKIKYLPFLILLFVKINFCNAQVNLVQNPSFEDYWSCPNGYSDFYKAKYWINFQNTPDLFSSCATISSGMNIPNSFAGYRYAASGNNCAAIATIQFNNFTQIREFIGTKLISPLIKNSKYFISIKIKPGYSASNGINLFTNNLSLLFLNVKLDSNIAQTLNRSHLKLNSVLTDTTNWTTLKGSFVADSGYTYLTIGNLYSDALTTIDSTIAKQQNLTLGASYMLLDNICVSNDSLFAYNYTYTGFSKLNNEIINNFKVFPNITPDYINIENIKLINYDYEIIDIDGKTILSDMASEYNHKINVQFLKSGIYFLRIKNNSLTANYKVLKIN
jgi:hypothetical protein